MIKNNIEDIIESNLSKKENQNKLEFSNKNNILMEEILLDDMKILVEIDRNEDLEIPYLEKSIEQKINKKLKYENLTEGLKNEDSENICLSSNNNINKLNIFNLNGKSLALDQKNQEIYIGISSINFGIKNKDVFLNFNKIKDKCNLIKTSKENNMKKKYLIKNYKKIVNYLLICNSIFYCKKYLRMKFFFLKKDIKKMKFEIKKSDSKQLDFNTKSYYKNNYIESLNEIVNFNQINNLLNIKSCKFDIKFLFFDENKNLEITRRNHLILNNNKLMNKIRRYDAINNEYYNKYINYIWIKNNTQFSCKNRNFVITKYNESNMKIEKLNKFKNKFESCKLIFSNRINKKESFEFINYFDNINKKAEFLVDFTIQFKVLGTIYFKKNKPRNFKNLEDKSKIFEIEDFNQKVDLIELKNLHDESEKEEINRNLEKTELKIFECFENLNNKKENYNNFSDIEKKIELKEEILSFNVNEKAEESTSENFEDRLNEDEIKKNLEKKKGDKCAINDDNKSIELTLNRLSTEDKNQENYFKKTEKKGFGVFDKLISLTQNTNIKKRLSNNLSKETIEAIEIIKRSRKSK